MHTFWANLSFIVNKSAGKQNKNRKFHVICLHSVLQSAVEENPQISSIHLQFKGNLGFRNTVGFGHLAFIEIRALK